MKPSTMSLFEREMRDQVSAARDAVAEAERRKDTLLVQATQNHLDSLIALARRNGVSLDVEAAGIPAPAAAADGAATLAAPPA
jgi:hypothetical protein